MTEVMICAPADGLWTIPGSVFDKICVRCAAPVMMAPSGVRYMETHTVEVICMICFDPQGRDRNVAKKIRLTAPVSVINGELMNVTRNYRARTTN